MGRTPRYACNPENTLQLIAHPAAQRRSRNLQDQIVSGPCTKKYMDIDIPTSKSDLRLLPQEMQQDSSENWYYKPQKGHDRRNKIAADTTSGISGKFVNMR